MIFNTSTVGGDFAPGLPGGSNASDDVLFSGRGGNGGRLRQPGSGRGGKASCGPGEQRAYGGRGRGRTREARGECTGSRDNGAARSEPSGRHAAVRHARHTGELRDEPR